jgi:hypothetical protein
MLYLFVVLKLPIVAACLIIWWAVRQETEPDEDSGGGGGRRRPHPAPKLPHAPRRGPHREAAPPSPARVRTMRTRTRVPLR